LTALGASIAPSAVRERPPLSRRAESSHPFEAWNP